MKLSAKFPGGSTPKIQEIIDAFGSHVEVDLQQRGVEFSQLFRKYSGMRTALLEPMPPIERDTTMLEESENQGNILIMDKLDVKQYELIERFLFLL